MMLAPHALQLKQIFLDHGYEHAVAAKQYATCTAFQDWQFWTLFRHGLKPHHDFLDVGCGWLRLAYVLLPYLEDGRYHGIDAEQVNLDIGREWLQQGNIQPEPRVLCNDEFEFEQFGTTFDYALIHAVFTHLSHDQIEQCLVKLRDVMKPGGTALFTFYRARRDQDRSTRYKLKDGEDLSYASAHLTLRYLRRLLDRIGVTGTYLGTLGHPTGHHVMRVDFSPDERAPWSRWAAWHGPRKGGSRPAAHA